jgi:hypothetical protein
MIHLVDAMAALESTAAEISTPTPQQSQGHKKGSKSSPKNMDPGKAEILVEKTCLNAARNRRWQNEPLEETNHDCIEAKRELPCSLCTERENITINFPSRDFPYSVFPTPRTTSKRSGILHAMKLKKKERPLAMEQLSEFAILLFEREIYIDAHRH